MTHLPATERIRGVLSPVVTPFDHQLRPDGDRLAKHCRWLLEQGVGLAVFGTNSEANSMSVAEKIALLDTLVAAGLPSPPNAVPKITFAVGIPHSILILKFLPRPGLSLRCAPTYADARRLARRLP